MKITLKKKQSGGGVDAFMHDFHASTKPHPFDRNARVHNDTVSVTLHKHDDHVHFSDIQNNYEQGTGRASRTLKHITSLADKHGVTISGTAKAYSNHPKHVQKSKQLASWYKKHGFTISSGNEKDGYGIAYKGNKKS